MRVTGKIDPYDSVNTDMHPTKIQFDFQAQKEVLFIRRIIHISGMTKCI